MSQLQLFYYLKGELRLMVFLCREFYLLPKASTTPREKSILDPFLLITSDVGSSHMRTEYLFSNAPHPPPSYFGSEYNVIDQCHHLDHFDDSIACRHSESTLVSAIPLGPFGDSAYSRTNYPLILGSWANNLCPPCCRLSLANTPYTRKSNHAPSALLRARYRTLSSGQCELACIPHHSACPVKLKLPRVSHRHKN